MSHYLGSDTKMVVRRLQYSRMLYSEKWSYVTSNPRAVALKTVREHHQGAKFPNVEIL